MIIQIDAIRPRRQPGLLAVLQTRLAPLFRRPAKRRRAPSIGHMSEYLRRDIGLAP